MTTIESIRAFEIIEEGVYKISKALVEFNRKGYDPGGINDAIEMAEIYVKGYEEDHPEVKNGEA